MESVFSGKRFSSSVLSLRAVCAALLVGMTASAWSATDPTPAPKVAAPKAAEQKVASVININTADANTLTELHGVGPAKAAAIVDYRKQHGPFKSVEQLAEVKGIGDALIAKNRSRISLR